MNRFVLIALAGALVIASCKNQPYKNVFDDPILYARTVKELNNVVLQNNFPPIIASRNYAYAAIAGYEAMAAGNPAYVSLGGQIKHLTPMPKFDTAQVNFQYAALLAYCKVGEAVTFPKGSLQKYIASLDSMADANGMPNEMKSSSKRFADSVGNYVLAWSKKDNYAQTRTAVKYQITKEEGRWIPTPPAYIEALEPHWKEIRPMVMDSGSQFMPQRPPVFNVKDTNGAFYKEVIAVKRAKETLTDEQKHIAMFWDDLGSRLEVEGHVMFTAKKFTPTGHWMNIAGIAAKTAKADFATTVYGYAKTAIAMFDAFIQCWDEKYRSNYARPETIINKYIDADWRPLLQTPPFPEYTCGHSTVSAAAAEALTSVYGDNFAYTDTSELEFGIKSRSFKSFREAAIENNWARFYGGIHYHGSCIISTESGKKVGELINNRLRMKK